MIIVYYTRFTSELDTRLWRHYLDLLPVALRKKNAAYKRWQDRHAHLLGKVLLYKGLKELGYQGNPLSAIRYTNYNRPYVEGDIDFNISHSGQYVLCAIGNKVRLGVDIEKMQAIDLSSYTEVMNSAQWSIINKHVHPVKAFYQYWTMKESIIKADSRGLSIPLADIDITNSQAAYECITWQLHQLNIDSEYAGYLAVNDKNALFKLNFMALAETIIEQT